MPKGSSVFSMTLGLVALAGTATAAEGPVRQEASVANDPYQWLEDVTGDKSIAWVREQNAKSEAELAANADFRKLEGQIRDILDSDAKIPGIEKIGDHYYNFWKDKQDRKSVV